MVLDALKWEMASLSLRAAVRGSREATMSLTTANPSSDLPEVVTDPMRVRMAFVDLIPPVYTHANRYSGTVDRLI